MVILSDIYDYHDYGYELRKDKTKYNSSIIYRNIFQFTIYNIFNINGLFKNNSYYNKITISNYNKYHYINLLTNYFNNSNNITIVYFDRLVLDNLYHTSCLIYRPIDKLLEVFDPDLYECEIINEVVESISLNLNLNFTKTTDLYPNFVKSLKLPKYSSLNYLTFFVRNTDGIDGWCQIWCLFISYLIYKYDNIPTSLIISNIYEVIINNYKNDNVNERRKRYSLRSLNIIRGFFYKIIESSNDFLIHKIDKNSLLEYNTEYVINDKENSEHIDKVLSERVLYFFN